MQRRVIGTLVAALAALAVAGCGSSDDEIPSGEAQALLEELDTLESEVNSESCEDADETLNALFTRTNELPGGDTKRGVRELLDNLDSLVDEQCSDVESEPTTTTDAEPIEPTTTAPEPTTTEPTTTETTTETTTPSPPGGGPPGGGPPGGGTGGSPPGGGTGGTSPNDQGND